MAGRLYAPRFLVNYGTIAGSNGALTCGHARGKGTRRTRPLQEQDVVDRCSTYTVLYFNEYPDLRAQPRISGYARPLSNTTRRSVRIGSPPGYRTDRYCVNRSPAIEWCRSSRHKHLRSTRSGHVHGPAETSHLRDDLS